MDAPNSAETAQTIASNAVGELCWRARRGHGSFLTFDLGDRISDRVGERGVWHLWVYFGEWKLSENGRVMATNWDDQPLIEEAVARFSGARLVDVVVDAYSLSRRASVCSSWARGRRGATGALTKPGELSREWR